MKLQESNILYNIFRSSGVFSPQALCVKANKTGIGIGYLQLPCCHSSKTLPVFQPNVYFYPINIST